MSSEWTKAVWTTTTKTQVDVSASESPRPSPIRCLAILVVVLFTATTSSADWVVTKDGSRVETAGPWTVEGKLVIFERPDGRLASMALRDVDLDASVAVTRDAARPPEPAPPAAPEPEIEAVMVLTDDDVLHVDPAETAGYPGEGAVGDDATGSDEEASPEEDPPPAGPENRLGVTAWDQTANAEGTGLSITGTLANTSQEAAADVRMNLRFLDRDGALLESVPAILSSTTLLPGQSTRFRAEAVGIFDFDELGFETSSIGLKTRSEEGNDPPEPVDGR